MTKPKIKLKPKNSSGSSSKPKRASASTTGQQLSLREKPRSKATRSKTGNGSTSPLARVKARKKPSGASLRQPGVRRVASSGGSSKNSKRKADDHQYRTIDGKLGRVTNRRGSKLKTFEVRDLGAGILEVVCPKDGCRRSFTIAKEWLKGTLFHLRPEQTVAGAPEYIIYETAGCPWCGSYSWRHPEGEGLSDDDFD